MQRLFDKSRAFFSVSYILQICIVIILTNYIDNIISLTSEFLGQWLL